MNREPTNYLLVNDPSKQWVADRLTGLLNDETIIPSFPNVAMRLCSMVQNENTTMEDFAKVISLDTALATRCLQIASSMGFAARHIDSIEQALMLIGVQQIRRIALAVATIGALSEFKAQVDWQRFWLHNVLVARLTDKVSATFRQTTGVEYLTGLLHDVGKLFVEHYFPKEFEQVLAGSIEKQCNHATMERAILGLDHTQIGAALCERMEVHSHLLRAVWFHHDPLNVSHTSDPDGDGGFLAVCVGIGDRLANSNPSSREDFVLASEVVEQSPEWIFLQTQFLPRRLELDLDSEFKKANEDLRAVLG
jgi:HD-like signal output (HDOD) protein